MPMAASMQIRRQRRDLRRFASAELTQPAGHHARQAGAMRSRQNSMGYQAMGQPLSPWEVAG